MDEKEKQLVIDILVDLLNYSHEMPDNYYLECMRKIQELRGRG